MLKKKLFFSTFLLFILFNNTVFSQEKIAVLNAVIIVPQDFDDIEFATVIDIFTKARIKFTTVGAEALKQRSISGFPVVMNRTTDKIQSKNYDLIVLLGGKTGVYYNQFPDVESLLHDFYAADKLIGALSAAPMALDRAGLLKRRNITIDPALSGQLSKDVNYIANKATIDGNIVTGYGPGNAAEFALLIVNYLRGYQMADKVRAELYL